MSPYRTRTYIAAKWDEDYPVVETLRKWNESDHWTLDFVDAHELHQARDTSQFCSIKHSLSERLAHSKTFVLVVGNNTRYARAGSCQYCTWYSALRGCSKNGPVDTRSYLQFECDYAVNNDLHIVVIYRGAKIDWLLCPKVLRNVGHHVPYVRVEDFPRIDLNYQGIKEALENR